jgi:SET domain-containing protein
MAVCMLPLLDLINHSNRDVANARIEQNRNGSFSCFALRDIHAGEEVCCSVLLQKRVFESVQSFTIRSSLMQVLSEN